MADDSRSDDGKPHDGKPDERKPDERKPAERRPQGGKPHERKGAGGHGQRPRGSGGKPGERERKSGGPRRGSDRDSERDADRGGEVRRYDGVVTWEPGEGSSAAPKPRRRRGGLGGPPGTGDAGRKDEPAKPLPPKRRGRLKASPSGPSGLTIKVGVDLSAVDAARSAADQAAAAASREDVRDHFAACPLGVEAVLVDELLALGAQDVVSQPGGASFRGTRELGYRACLWLRCAIRVQEVLLRGSAGDQRSVYGLIHELPWEDLIGNTQTLAVNASVRDAALTHSGFAAQLVKDAVVDRCRAKTGDRPSVDRKAPDLPLKLRLHGTELLLSRDLTGESLHKRGYRTVQVKSPINEALAAGLLQIAGWSGQGHLADPMCGSGTFLIEAAYLLGDVAPGLRRRFACERWRDADGQAWARLREEAFSRAADGALGLVVERRRPSSWGEQGSADMPKAVAHPRDELPQLLGADRHAGALSIARLSVAAAGLDGVIGLAVSEVARWKPRPTPRIVVCNPPYGERLGEGDDLRDAWGDLGRFLREQCAGATAWILSGSPELPQEMGLRSSLRVPVSNGPISCRWLRYELGG